MTDPRTVPPRITLAAITRFYDEAMAAEDIGGRTRERVANRVIWGSPEGFQEVRRVTERALREASREEVLEIPAEVIAQLRQDIPDSFDAQGCFVAPGPATMITGITDDGTVTGPARSRQVTDEPGHVWKVTGGSEGGSMLDAVRAEQQAGRVYGSQPWGIHREPHDDWGGPHRRERSCPPEPDDGGFYDAVGLPPPT